MPDRPARLLVLVRHAQAETFAVTDHARALTARGRADASAAGRWLNDLLRARGHEGPDAAVVSDAVRARETWEAVADAGGWELVAQPDRAAYEAAPESLLDLVRLVDAEARCVVVVGHNPTVGVLTQLLDDGSGDPRAIAATAGGHPTAGVAVLEVPGAWGDLDDAGAVLTGFHVGRG
ncbi:SixA phosphatase family protein [Nocardioides perillae]|uniref:Phosphohistidine phosphatase n=1 Tax=Nocardioides perillae TaxID=1119534 RepID=A0A7Y9UMB3_9ACTN|nr:phosphohistidine phosphatase [Nocardioides perillae]